MFLVHSFSFNKWKLGRYSCNALKNIRNYHSSLFLSTSNSFSNSGTTENDGKMDNENASAIRNKIKTGLIKFRKVLADETQKPLFLILQNRQIDSIVAAVPRTEDQLKNLLHIGPKTMLHAPKIMEIISNSIGSKENINNINIKPIELPKKIKKVKDSSIANTKIHSEDLRTVLSFSIDYNDLNDEKKLAASHILTNKTNNVFITGSAGTGKSFLLRYVIEELRKEFAISEVGVTAPTGIAAVNVGGMTLHSFAGLGIIKDEDSEIDLAFVTGLKKQKKIVKRIRQLKVLIIDEVSMLSLKIFELIDILCKDIRNNYSAPFGGIRIIAVGDFLQLPPVNKGNSNNNFCFQSRIWEDAGLNKKEGIIHLNEINRQTGEEFITLLNKVRLGDVKSEDLELLNSCLIKNKPLPTDGIIPTKLYCLNKDVDKENIIRLNEIPDDPIEIFSEDVWKVNDITLNSVTRNMILSTAEKSIPSKIVLKRGAQVVLTRNRFNDILNYNNFNLNISPGSSTSNNSVKKPLVNGSRGVVVGFAESVKGRGLIPIVRFDDGQVVSIGKVDFEVSQTAGGGSGDSVLVRQQVPLKLAWATTVHKSQGSTLSRAELLVSDSFEFGQCYVALSRLSSLEGLYLSKPLTLKSIKTNPQVLDFYQNIQK